MIRKSVCLIIVLAYLSIGSAQQSGEDQVRFEAVKQYWEWSSYFGLDGLDFPSLKYQAGRSFQALIFFDQMPAGNPKGWYSSAYWGFCSTEVGICQAYGGNWDGTVDQARGTKIKKGEREEVALKRFRESGFSSDEDGPPAAPTVLTSPPANTPASRGGVVLTQPVPVDPYDIRTRRGQIILPKLDLPAAVRQKISNADAQQAVQATYDPQKARCTTIVPFADERAPYIPILNDCQDGPSILQIRKENGWSFTAGGFFQDKAILNRLAPRIRSNASLVLKPGR